MINPNSLFGALDISASGMSAERFRMEVVANNIANSQTSLDKNGEPFRRKQVVFQTQFNETMNQLRDVEGAQTLGGVRVVEVVPDMSDLKEVYLPGHPHANQEGIVRMPNVHLPNEMVDLVSATRVYEANLKAIQSFKQMVEQSLQLLRAEGKKR